MECDISSLIAEEESGVVYYDEDGNGNSIGEEKDLCDGYAATVQSQANNLRDIMAAASDAGALGVFYWEGAWIPVGANDQKTVNAKLWNNILV